jgi:hypothetical protein
MGCVFRRVMLLPIKMPRPADEKSSFTKNGTRRGNVMGNGTEVTPLERPIAAALSELGLPPHPVVVRRFSFETDTAPASGFYSTKSRLFS